jgi:molybdopterin-guanine dinucleotide biosynthesis protein A
MAVSGIVLAGGESKRLGAEKALLDFGGSTLLEITVERLREVTADIVVACGQGKRPSWPSVDAQMVLDRSEGRGPLAGLDAGLRRIANEAAVVVACDMPFLNPALLALLAGRLETHAAVVPMFDGRYHALHAVYSQRCLPFVEDLLLKGGSMRDLLAAVDTRVVPEVEVREVDPAGLSCFNLNVTADLEAARAIWVRERLGA